MNPCHLRERYTGHLRVRILGNSTWAKHLYVFNPRILVGLGHVTGQNSVGWHGHVPLASLGLSLQTRQEASSCLALGSTFSRARYLQWCLCELCQCSFWHCSEQYQKNWHLLQRLRVELSVGCFQLNVLQFTHCFMLCKGFFSASAI